MGQESFTETENQIYETQREQLQYEREQARKEVLEEVGIAWVEKNAKEFNTWLLEALKKERK